MLNTVKVPKQFESLFEKAQEAVGRYFSAMRTDPSKGIIEISGERYIMIRAASMSVDFFNTVVELYKDQGKEEAFNIARQFLFDIAHAVGKQDAKKFSEKLGLVDPVEKLSAGPVHFSHSGWAFVDILPESKPSPDENFYLIYDHVYSFESDAWIRASEESDYPVCVMNSGYSSGWCEESFGIGLVATEITCKARGDEACRFIMAPPSKISDRIIEYSKRRPELSGKTRDYEIPGFFKRKQLEDELRFHSEIVKNMADGVCLVRTSDKTLVYTNPKFEQMFGYNSGELLEKNVTNICAPADKSPEDTLKEIVDNVAKNGEWHGEVKHIKKDGTIFWSFANASSFIHPVYGKVLLAVHSDIDKRKKFQSELEKINEMMNNRESEIADLKKEIKDLKKTSKK